MNASRSAPSHVAAIVGSVLVGAAVVATRSAVDEIGPFSLAFLRYLQGGLILLALLAWRDSSRLRINRGDLRTFGFLGLLMYALFPVLFNTSLTFTTASRGAVILSTMPLWGALLARRYTNERLAPVQIGGVMISVAGVTTVFTESGLNDFGGVEAITGNLLMLGAAVIAGYYGVRMKGVLKDHSALQVTAFAMAIGALILAIPAVAEGLLRDISQASGQTLLLVVYLGIFGGALAFYLFSLALTRLSPTQALVYVNINPMVATLLAALLLDEPLTAFFGVGFAMVLAGLLLTNLRGQQRSNRTATAE
ncbi:EamA family transporter [soil metagenome]